MILAADSQVLLRGGPFDGEQLDAEAGVGDIIRGPVDNPHATCDADRVMFAHYGCCGWDAIDDVRVPLFVCLGYRRERDDADDHDLGRPPAVRQF